MCVFVCLNAEVRSLAPAASHMERTPQNRRRPVWAAFGATVFHGYAVHPVHASIAALLVLLLAVELYRVLYYLHATVYPHNMWAPSSSFHSSSLDIVGLVAVQRHEY